MVELYLEVWWGYSNVSGHSVVWVFPNVDHYEVHRRLGGDTRSKRQGQEWLSQLPVHWQTLPSELGAAWIVLVNQATGPHSRFKRLME